MDIEQMRKVNDMSRVLQSHGFAADSGEAAAQSSQIYGVNHGFEQASLTQEVPKEHIELAQESHEPSLSMINEVTQQFEQFKEETNSRLVQLEGNVSMVIKKMNEMIAVIKKLEEQPVQAQQQHNVSAPQESAKSEKPTEAKPRAGDFKPGDVDLNKVFYSGTH